MPSRLGRRQYPEAGHDVSTPIEQAHLMPHNPQQSFEAAHGTPTYISDLPSSYIAGAEQTQTDHSTDYKDINLNAYPVPSYSGTRENTGQDWTPPVMKRRKQPLRDRHKSVFKVIQRVIAFLFVAALLAIPIIVTADAREPDDASNKVRQNRNLIFYIFVMLENIWACAGVFYLIALVLPYLFRFVAHYVNPAHERYWRTLVILRLPLVVLFTIISGYICLTIVSRLALRSFGC